MILYLASTAPGSETKEKYICTPHRLLSYYLIKSNGFSDREVFNQMIADKRDGQ